MRYRKRVVVAGEGGQGIQVVGEILAASAYNAGLEALYIPNFGVEQRGGVSVAFVQVSDEPIAAPKFRHADIMALLSRRSFDRTKLHRGSDTAVIYDSSDLKTPVIDDKTVGIQGWETIAPEGFAASVASPGAEPDSEVERQNKGRLLPIPVADVAKDELTPRVMNMLVLGAILTLIDRIHESAVTEALEAKLGKKFAQDDSLRDLNKKAIARGQELVRLAQQGLHDSEVSDS